MNQDSSLSTVTGYKLEDSIFDSWHRQGFSSLPLCSDCLAHSAFYWMGTKSSFPDGKAATAWIWPLTSI